MPEKKFYGATICKCRRNSDDLTLIESNPDCPAPRHDWDILNELEKTL